MEIQIKIEDGAKMPTKAHDTDGGFDLYAPYAFRIEPGDAQWIDTGIHMNIPSGYVGFIKSKSGLNRNKGIESDSGVIDAGYTGGIAVKLKNTGGDYQSFNAGDKITQLVILPIPDIDLIPVMSLDDTERGDNGFGSSGR